MKVRCNRLGNLFLKRVVGEILFLYAFFAVPTVIWLIAEGSEWLQSWWALPFIELIPTIITLLLPLRYPKEFMLENQTLIWSERLSKVRNNKESCKTVVSVDDLHSIEFLQNSIERLFNIGRIRFLGEIRSMEAREPVERPIIPFYYGGICKFDQFEAQLRAHLPERAFQ